jgi:DNA-binding CsgD family transcriptional regulator
MVPAQKYDSDGRGGPVTLIERRTLIISRAKYMLPFCESYLGGMGFLNIHITSEEKDSLVWVLNELQPQTVFIESCFYESATPYMMGRLLRDMPKLNIAAFSLGEFPDDLALWFIFHGVKSYLNFRDDPDEFYRGLREIKNGKTYCTRKVLERLDLRKELPVPVLDITVRQNELLRLLCNGFTTVEAADTLHISKRTVETHKTDMYAIFHVRNERELIRVGYFLDLITKDELCFYGGNWEVAPLPEKPKRIKKKEE